MPRPDRGFSHLTKFFASFHAGSLRSIDKKSIITYIIAALSMDTLSLKGRFQYNVGSDYLIYLILKANQ